MIDVNILDVESLVLLFQFPPAFVGQMRVGVVFKVFRKTCYTFVTYLGAYVGFANPMFANVYYFNSFILFGYVRKTNEHLERLLLSHPLCSSSALSKL